MKLVRLLILAPALAVVALSAAAQTHPIPRRANIILIVADGLGFGDLSCYGQTMFQTPSLDQLALGGIRFTNYSAGDAVSSAARADLLLGKRIVHAPDADVALGPGGVTVAQLLKDSGYYTGLIGEWNLGDQNSSGAPWEQGFDQFAGYLNPADAANPYEDYVWRYDPQYIPAKHKVDLFNGRETGPVYPNVGGKKAQYLPDSFMRWAMNFAQIHRQDRFRHAQPFFLVLDETIPGNGYRPVPTDAPFSEESWPQAEKNRAAAISRLDDDIARLLQQLGQINQASNTVIFFTSDTVPQKGGGVDPQFFHENISTNDLRVPLIVYWPGKIPPGRVSGLKCSALDVLPTITSLSYMKPPDKIEGVSFARTLFGYHGK